MFQELDSAIATIERVLRDFERGLLDARGAVRAVERFAKVAHLGKAGLALGAKRVDETFAYRESGARSAADWLARKAGIAIAAAERSLDTADALAELPATNAAFRAGLLSEVQAREIVGAARKDPAAEAALVAEAKHGVSLKGLKDRCRRVRAGAEVDDAAWAQRLHDNRSLRAWIDPDTASCGMWRMSPDKGAEVLAAVDAETDLLFREARSSGLREAREAYAADALYNLVIRGPRKATGAKLVLDAEVLEQGFARTGQRCEIPGIGPIPVTIAKRMLADAKVRAVPRDADALPDFSSDSRHIPAWLKDWLDQRYPVCGKSGCDADFHLEYDHVIPVADGGRTEQANLWRLCWYHHRLKSTQDWRITGTTHNWDLEPPVGARAGPDPP